MRYLLFAMLILLVFPAHADWLELGKCYVKADPQAEPIVDGQFPGPTMPAAQTWHEYQMPEGAVAAILSGRLQHSRTVYTPSIWSVMDFCSKANSNDCKDQTTDTPGNTRNTAWKMQTPHGAGGGRGDQNKIVALAPGGVLKWRWNPLRWTTNNPSSATLLLWVDGYCEAP